MKKIVTIGGGTGQFMLLSELKKHEDVEITAVVNMTDAGGSTGLLRDELGVLPPGDARQALVALSESEQVWRDVFTYRFSEGGLSGHTVGNVLLSALEKMTGSFEKSLDQASVLLQTKGTVLPITLDNTQLIIENDNDEVLYGEGNIDESQLGDPKAIYFSKPPKLNPKVTKATKDADVIIFCPGNFYCTVVPNLLIGGMHQVLHKSRAKKIFISNLVSKYGHTTDMTVADFINRAHKAVDYNFIDTVIYNTQLELSDKNLEQKYAEDGEHLISPGDLKNIDVEKIGKPLIAKKVIHPIDGDSVKRSYIRHDAKKLVDIILKHS